MEWEETLIYDNALREEKDVQDWVEEGAIKRSFSGGLILENALSEKLGDYAHWTFWIPQEFPSDIKIEWKFKPLREPGLCMVFFAAKGKNNQSIFSEALQRRTGYYPQYHHGDLNAYHLSYFRHKYETERAFRTCNLRKSYGFHFAAQGADPLPPVEDALEFYKVKLIKFQNRITFYINDLKLLDWIDEGKNGKPLNSGMVGFRQMAPMKAIYKDLKIYALKKKDG
ncbi:DUF1961 family protein [Jeotgalibaca ciconiae]|uniref:DUF1961 family protein n=1 Tax=Jeotgalibaca ciconiae TaxID=2496265 RepID=A0A3Q9BJL9_9LACT|nr:DUF1961 family protein [Jeotgalibaca ciconiae]AZP03862.1 DUF1961 family protein [Jeotgalibaca ciconiae]HJB23470.1 YesU family protein [Candidatus Jeotgalibaca pullicola]